MNNNNNNNKNTIEQFKKEYKPLKIYQDNFDDKTTYMDNLSKTPLAKKLFNLAVGRKVTFFNSKTLITHPGVLVRLLMKNQHRNKTLFGKEYKPGDVEFCTRCTYSKTEYRSISFYVPIKAKKAQSVFTHKDQVVVECMLDEKGLFRPILDENNNKNEFRNVFAMDFDLKATNYIDWLYSKDNKVVNDLKEFYEKNITDYDQLNESSWIKIAINSNVYSKSLGLDFENDDLYVNSEYYKLLEVEKQVQEDKILELVSEIGIPKAIIRNKHKNEMNPDDLWKFTTKDGFNRPKVFGFHIFWELDELLSGKYNFEYRQLAKKISKKFGCDIAFNHDIMKNIYSNAFDVLTFKNNTKISLKNLFESNLSNDEEAKDLISYIFDKNEDKIKSEEIKRANMLISYFNKLNHYSLNEQNEKLRQIEEAKFYKSQNNGRFAGVAQETRNNSLYIYMTRLNGYELESLSNNTVPSFVYSKVTSTNELISDEEFEMTKNSVLKARRNNNVPDSSSLNEHNKSYREIQSLNEERNGNNVENGEEFIDQWNNISSKLILKNLEIKNTEIDKKFVQNNFDKLYFASQNKKDFYMNFRKYSGLRIDGEEGIFQVKRSHDSNSNSFLNKNTPLYEMVAFIKNLGLEYVVKNISNFATDEFMSFAEKFIFTKTSKLDKNIHITLMNNVSTKKFNKDKVIGLFNSAMSIVFSEEKEIYNNIKKTDKQLTLKDDSIFQRINNGENVSYVDLYIKLIELDKEIDTSLFWNNGKPRANKVIISKIGTDYNKTDKLLKEIKNFWTTLYSKDNSITTQDVYELLLKHKKKINTGVNIENIAENTPMFVTVGPRSGKQKEMIDLIQPYDKLTQTTVQATNDYDNFEKLKEWLSKLKFKNKYRLYSSIIIV